MGTAVSFIGMAEEIFGCFFPCTATFFRDAEILAGRIRMVKLKCIDTAIIPALHARTAFIFNSHFTDILPSLINCGYQVLTAICVASCIAHCQMSPPSLLVPPKAKCLWRDSHSHMLYQLSYRGANFQRSINPFRYPAKLLDWKINST